MLGDAFGCRHVDHLQGRGYSYIRNQRNDQAEVGYWDGSENDSDEASNNDSDNDEVYDVFCVDVFCVGVFCVGSLWEDAIDEVHEHPGLKLHLTEVHGILYQQLKRL
mmetsp:Transcript_24930/g.44901  ORF Transcript_24930/g.44901 Transcript_24930/m.44901 type:complete len:107 (+) Transcript_24930:145-465(+)